MFPACTYKNIFKSKLNIMYIIIIMSIKKF